MMTTAAETTLQDILREQADRAFDSPWQAQAFALVVRLQKSGHITWENWVRVFSRQVAASPARLGESVNDAYYRQWLAALEQIVVESGFLAPGDTDMRTSLWRAAFVNTPHGQPVRLGNATCPPSRDHDSKPRGQPLVVSLASLPTPSRLR